MSSRDELRAMLERAAAAARPPGPDWAGAAGAAGRTVLMRRAAVAGAALACGALLLGGGLAARAAVGDDDDKPPAASTITGGETDAGDDGTDPPGTDTQTGTDPELPNLVAEVAPDEEEGGVIVTVRNEGRGAAGASTTSLSGAAKMATIAVGPLAPGRHVATQVDCTRRVRARADDAPGSVVKETDEGDNSAIGRCADPRPEGATPNDAPPGAETATESEPPPVVE